MAPSLELAFTLRGYLDKEHSVKVGAVKSGPRRSIVPITHGFIEGSGLRATLLPGGSDWLLLDQSKSLAYLDVRTQAKTDDGEGIYIRYKGVLKVDEALAKALAGSEDAETTQYGQHHFFSTPVMETSGLKYKWIEETVFVGEGRNVVSPDGSQAVEYQIYKVTN